MSFTLINPSTWAVGQKLTAAQINALDADHAKAVDKTGDTVTGALALGALASITSGAAAGGIAASIAGGIQSTTPGGIQLAGGANDWPAFSSARTVQVSAPMIAVADGGVWTRSSDGLHWTTDTAGTAGTFWLPSMHNGGTLNTVQLFWQASTHSGLPAGSELPGLSISRHRITGPDVFGQVLLNSGAVWQTGTYASPSAYTNGNAIQAFTYTCNQNNVIDTADYAYYAQVRGESGSNAVAGDQFWGFLLSYTVADMRF